MFCRPSGAVLWLGLKPRAHALGYLLPPLRGFFSIILIFLSSSIAVGQSQQFFPFSVWYSGGKARAPMLEPVDETSRARWKKDLEQIKGLGFNTVRTWVEWTAGEPQPGKYSFENLKLLSELAQQAGLKVLIQVYVDSAPDWIGQQFADARFVAQSGAVIPSQSAPGYCFDHKQVQEKILNFYRETARVATRYPNFIGWDLWSEPHIINWAIIDFVPNATFCYCPSSIQRFRGWLQKKYGSIDRLNLAWYRTFTGWEQVEPPRFGTILSYTDFIDWRLYIQQKLAEDLKARAEAVKSVDPGQVVTSHAAVPCLFTSPLWGVGAPDDWLMAQSVDYWGTSIYPKHSFPNRHWDLLRFSVVADFARSAGRSRNGFYVGEFQAGMGIRGTVVGDPITPADHRFWAWSLLSRGARAINVYAYYPMNSGYEAGGYGLINLDGTLTDRSKEIGRIARIADRNQSIFLKAAPRKAEIALVYNPLSFLVGGEQHLSGEGAVRDSLIGIYRAFFRRNIASDFVHLREIEEGDLSSYKVVFLPYPLMLTVQAADGLKKFVERGGTLVVEARAGWNDDRGYAQDIVPGFGLDEVLGVREGALKMQDKVEIRVASADPLLGDLKSGDILIGRAITEQLVPYSKGRVLATFADGSPAVVAGEYGKGKTITVGSFLGMANGQQRNENTERFFLGVAQSAGIKPVVPLQGIPEDIFVEARLLDAGPDQLLYLFNHSDQQVTARLPLKSGQDLNSNQTENLGQIKLEPRGIKVYVISPGGGGRK